VKAKVALGVSALWLAAALQGKSEPILRAISTALHQSLPWIPGTLAVVWLAARFPVTRQRWAAPLLVHLLAMPAIAFGTNVLVVLGFWASSGSFGSLLALVREGARWGLVRLHLAAILYAGVAALTQLALSWRRLRQHELDLARLEVQLAESRLEALNAQIRPHFLFNTLHAIGQLWRAGRAEQADALLDHLGALFQRVISSTARRQVPLSEELEMVRQYLAIEHARFGERLVTHIDADEAALACLVPPLVLQPLVENAVRHGVSRLVGAGEVRVVARLEAGRLRLSVEDDGPGLNGDGAVPGTGTGLRNVRERLQSVYRGEQSVETLSRQPSGTEVRLMLPARERD
jgi:signal transduction histidine kinase